MSSHLMLLQLYMIAEASGWGVQACAGVQVLAAAGREVEALPSPPKRGDSGSLTFPLPLLFGRSWAMLYLQSHLASGRVRGI